MKGRPLGRNRLRLRIDAEDNIWFFHTLGETVTLNFHRDGTMKPIAVPTGIEVLLKVRKNK